MFEPAGDEIKILFDAGWLIRQQYISMKRPYAEELFNNWFEAYTLKRAIDVVELKGTTNFYAELIALGVPKKEHVYFRVAIIGKATLLVSIDSDFFDPRKKKAGTEEKKAILRSGNGPVCRHMKKSHKVIVCCPEVFVTMIARV
jgi:hypothetical protein